MIGRSLGHYEVTGKLGAGGMGEVYRARDTKLGREVALKVLPASVAQNPDRLARFEREAKLVAALNHPNIVTLHSIEKAEGTTFMTMELVDGHKLSEEIDHGLAMERLLEYAIPLADAVAAAHQQGILHRDLKPDNVMISRDGRVKVLDFGLGKLRQEAAESSGTHLATQDVTGAGIVMGTAAYMSPEQAEGLEVDARSDVFSLGIVLYEMSTGKKPFKGDTPISTITSILRDTPQPVTVVKPTLPRELQRVVRRCLAKDPNRRFQTVLDLRNELEELKTDLDEGDLSGSGASEGSPPSSKGGWVRGWWGKLVLAFVATFSFAAAWMIRGTQDEEGAALSPLDVSLMQLTDLVGSEMSPSLSPDGKQLLYVGDGGGNQDIYLQRVGGFNAINLTADHQGDDFAPAWSPDGETIAFCSDRAGGGIFLMGATGESPRRLCDTGYHPAWSPDGSQIAYTTERIVSPVDRGSISQIWVIDVAMGAKRKLYDGDAAQAVWSPDGKRLAFWSVLQGQRDIQTIASDGSHVTFVTHDVATDWTPFWSPDGRWLYFVSDRAGYPNLWRVPIDEDRGVPRGEPQAVTAGTTSLQFASISATGDRIAYAVLDHSGMVQRVPLDAVSLQPQGDAQPILRSSNAVAQIDVSPDGEWLAYRTTLPEEDVYVVHTDGSFRRQLTRDADRDRGLRWSPDGQALAFYSNRGGAYQIWTVRPDGTGLRPLTDYPGGEVLLPVWSPDGRRVACTTTASKGLVGEITGDLPVTQFRELPALDAGEFWPGAWSRDGRLLAGTGVIFETGMRYVAIFDLETETFDIPVDATGARLASGEWVSWLADSRRLLFYEPRRKEIMVYDRTARGASTVLPVEIGVAGGFTITPDGKNLFIASYPPRADVWLLELE